MRGIQRMGNFEKCAEQQMTGDKGQKCLHDRVIVPTALYEAEECCMRSSERRKVNVLEMKC